MIITCPRCFTFDDVSSRRLPGRMLEYTCSADHGGAGEHVWLGSLDQATSAFDTDEGVTRDLLQPMLTCVRPGDPFVEYGIVEYRLREGYPDLLSRTFAIAGTSCSRAAARRPHRACASHPR